MQATGNHGRLLRISQVLERIPVSKTTWYDGIRKGVYPAPVRLAPRTSAWLESEIKKLIVRLHQGKVEYPQ
ncbi:helix-turn-helix transcriptional regulator [Humidesulfovibrio idahonensis]